MVARTSDDRRFDEKVSTSIHREHAATVEEEGLAQGYDAGETAKLLRKVDYRLLPVLSFLYLLAFLDRSNLGQCVLVISNARSTSLTFFRQRQSRRTAR